MASQSGNTLSELFQLVEQIAQRAEMLAERSPRHSEKIYLLTEPCVNCGQELGDHSGHAEFCPENGGFSKHSHFLAVHGQCENMRSLGYDPTGENAQPCGANATYRTDLEGYFCTHCLRQVS